MSSSDVQSGASGVRSETPADLLDAPLKVVNVGLESFSEELKSAGVPVVHVVWTPPANGDPKLADILSKLGA